MFLKVHLFLKKNNKIDEFFQWEIVFDTLDSRFAISVAVNGGSFSHNNSTRHTPNFVAQLVLSRLLKL